MAENVNALILPIGADVTQFQKSINDVKDRIKELSSTIKATPFNLVTQGQRDELAGLIDTLDKLNTSVAKTSSTFGQSEGPTKGARTALTSLSLIAQDLPFGFIAIQNNLPAVIQSFGQLSAASGGLKAALGQIGSALVGPAGLFLAFSVVTAGITFAVQKYGSLSNAITAIVSDNEDLAKTIAKVNKEYESYNNSLDNLELSVRKSEAADAGKIETIKILTETVTNLENSELKRSTALNNLKSIDKDYYGSFTTSAEDSEKLRKATDKLTESIIRQAKIKGLEGRITEITTALLDVEDAQAQIAPAFTESANKVEKSLAKAGQFGQLTIQDVGEVINLDNITTQLSKGDAAIEKETNKLQKTKERLQAELDGIINIGKDVGDGKVKDILKLDTQELDAAFNLKDIKSRVNEYGNILLNVNNTEKQRSNALKELIAINPAFANTLSLNKSRLEENKLAIEDNIRSLNVLIQQREFDKRATEVNNQFLKEQEKQRERNIQAEEKEADAIISLAMANDKLTSSGKQVFLTNGEFFKQIAAGVEVIEMLKKALNLEDAYNKALENLVNFAEFQRKEIDKIVKDLRFLQEPLEGLFTTFFDGASADWKSFADDVIKQIKRVTAALLAKSLIQGLANIFAPGAGSLISGGLKGISDAGLLDFLGTGGVKSPSFGGISGGPLQMAGAVNLSLRGSDLVGSINRTNATINRVG